LAKIYIIKGDNEGKLIEIMSNNVCWYFKGREKVFLENNFEGEIIVMKLFNRKIINLSTFDNIFDMKIHYNLVIWTNYFNNNKKEKIRSNVLKYIHKPHRYIISFCNSVWKIGRKLQLLGECLLKILTKIFTRSMTR
jgi:hypothetical protein